MFLSTLVRIASAVVIAPFAWSVSAADLEVRITGITDKASPIHVFVFTSAEGFPKEVSAAVHVRHAAPNGVQLDLVIPVPDAAQYALMAYQDRNGDGKLNRFLGMIPQEPYALSRNPDVMGKPKFTDAALKPVAGEAIILNLKD
jgi:uncharacterized protein (DUF2141 family)